MAFVHSDWDEETGDTFFVLLAANQSLSSSIDLSKHVLLPNHLHVLALDLNTRFTHTRLFMLLLGWICDQKMCSCEIRRGGRKKMGGIRYANMCLRQRPTGMKSKLKTLKKQKKKHPKMCSTHATLLIYFEYKHIVLSPPQLVKQSNCEATKSLVREGGGLHPAGHAGIHSAYFWPRSSRFASGPVWAD